MGFGLMKPGSIESSMDHQEDPQLGDLIEIDRGHFAHWAVYIGYNKVVHLIVNSGNDTRGFVKREKLKDVVKDDLWKINNLLDGENTPWESSDIVEEALDQINTEQQYDVLENNCEHFVTWLCYGISESLQVQTVVAAV